MGKLENSTLLQQYLTGMWSMGLGRVVGWCEGCLAADTLDHCRDCAAITMQLDGILSTSKFIQIVWFYDTMGGSW